MPNGLPNDLVRAICQIARADFRIGSNNGMLWYDWYWANHFFAYNTHNGLSDSFVSAICEERGETLGGDIQRAESIFRRGSFSPNAMGRGCRSGR